MMMNKKINSTFGHRVIGILKEVVPDQSMELKDSEGHIWSSTCKAYDGMALTVIHKDYVMVARITYDYEDGIETTHIY